LLARLEIDDVVDASPVHMACGMWGTLAAGIFAHPENTEMAYGNGSCGLLFRVSTRLAFLLPGLFNVILGIEKSIF